MGAKKEAARKAAPSLYYESFCKSIRFRSVKRLAEYFSIHPLLAWWWLYEYTARERMAGMTPRLHIADLNGTSSNPPAAQLMLPAEFVDEVVAESEGKLSKGDFADNGTVSKDKVDAYIYRGLFADRYHPGWVDQCQLVEFKGDWGVIYTGY